MHQKNTSPDSKVPPVAQNDQPQPQQPAASSSSTSGSGTSWSAIVKKGQQSDKQQQTRAAAAGGASTPPAQQMSGGTSATTTTSGEAKPKLSKQSGSTHGQKKHPVVAMQTDELLRTKKKQQAGSTTTTPSQTVTPTKSLRGDAKEFSPSKERVAELKRESWADSPCPAEDGGGDQGGGGSASRLRSDAAEFTPSKSPQKASSSASPSPAASSQQHNSASRSPATTTKDMKRTASAPARKSAPEKDSSKRAITPSTIGAQRSSSSKRDQKAQQSSGIMGRGDEKWEKGAEELRLLVEKKREGFEKEVKARPNLVPTALRKLMVAQIPMYFTEDDLRQMFQAYGALSFVKVVCHESTGQSRGFGFVEYYSSYAAMMAKQGLDGFQIEFNKKLQIRYADEAGASVANPQIVHRPQQVLEALAFQQDRDDWLWSQQAPSQVLAEGKEVEESEEDADAGAAHAGSEVERPYSSFGSPATVPTTRTVDLVTSTPPKPLPKTTSPSKSRGGGASSSRGVRRRAPYQHSPYGSNVLSPPSPEKQGKEENSHQDPSSGGTMSGGGDPSQFSVVATSSPTGVNDPTTDSWQQQEHQEEGYGEEGYYHSSSYHQGGDYGGTNYHQDPYSSYYSCYPVEQQQGYFNPPSSYYHHQHQQQYQEGFSDPAAAGWDIPSYNTTTGDGYTAGGDDPTNTGLGSTTAASTTRKKRGKRGGAKKQKRIQEIQEAAAISRNEGEQEEK